MSQIAWLTQSRYATAAPKLVAAFRKTEVDTTAPSAKNNNVRSAGKSKVDTVEISDNQKEADAPAEKTAGSALRSDVEELVNYVRERAKEIRESNKPIPGEIVRAFIDQDPNKEKVERSTALGAKAGEIDAKMRSGKLPNEEEMSFLKEHFPELYMIAKRIEMEREQFRNQLNNCDTKEEKTRLVLLKKSQLMEEAKSMLKAKIEPTYVICMLAAIDEEIEEDEKRNGKAGNMENAIVKKTDAHIKTKSTNSNDLNMSVLLDTLGRVCEV